MRAIQDALVPGSSSNSILPSSNSDAITALESSASPSTSRSSSSPSPPTSSSSSPSTSPTPSPSKPSSSPPSASRGSVHTLVQNLVAGLASKGIMLTEWGAVLYVRLNVPAICVALDFLVDDDLIDAACQFTEEQGYRPTEDIPILLETLGKYEAIARHFDCFGRRVNFYPGSFAGFRADELNKVPLNLDDASAMPVSVFTPTPASLAASFVRLIGQVAFDDPMSLHLKHDLCLVLSYNLFDMSYEGNYMVLGEETQEEIDLAINGGLDLFRKWEGWRDDEMWIADALEAIIQGKGKYDFLPSKSLK